MNKLDLSVVLSLGLVLSPLCALDSNTLESKKNMQSPSLSQTDEEFLFATNASHLNVVALSDEEMRLTEGEGFFTSLGIGILVGGVQWGYNCIFKGKCKDWQVNVRF